MSFTSARRDLGLVVGAKSVSWLGDEVALVALTLRLQSDGRGPTAVAALLMANLVPIVLLSGLVGRVVDRYDNRRLLIVSSLVQVAVCCVLAFISSAPVILGLMALLGAGQGVNGATWQALLPAIVGKDRLPKAIGLTQAGNTIAGVVAPPVAGLLTGFYGARVPLLVDAASFAVVCAAALTIRTRRVVAPRVAGAAREHGGLAIVRADVLLRPLFVLLALFVLIGSMVNVVDVFLVRETLHASTTWYGITGAVFSVGALAGALASGRLSGSVILARGFVVSAAVLAVAIVAIGQAPTVVWLLPAGFVAGAGNGVLNVMLGSLVMGRARDAERGRIGALLSGVASGTQLVAFAAGGLLAAHLSPRTVFALAGGLGLAAPVLLGRRLVRAARQSVPAAAAAADTADSAPVTTAASAASA
jgi:MFS family permease